MVERDLKPRGITDPKVLATMARVPRHLFVDEGLGYRAYGDHALPIGQAQTISQPFMVAWMSQALSLTGEERALEIGTGSGYHAAVLSHLVKVVYSVERHPKLVGNAKRLLSALDYHNVIIKLGDGTDGWQEYAPYDVMSVAAYAKTPPPALLKQLKIGGRLVIPISHHSDDDQMLMLYVKESEKRMKGYRLGSCSFVPFVSDRDKAANANP